MEKKKKKKKKTEKSQENEPKKCPFPATVIFNCTGTVLNNFVGTVRNYGSIFFPGSNYERNLVPYRTASLAHPYTVNSGAATCTFDVPDVYGQRSLRIGLS